MTNKLSIFVTDKIEILLNIDLINKTQKKRNVMKKLFVFEIR